MQTMPVIADLTTGISDALERTLGAMRADWAIRKSVAQNYGQLLQELRDLQRLPAVVIVPGSGNYFPDGLGADATVALILIAKFSVSQPGRVAEVQSLLDRTAAHFHPVRDLGACGYARPSRWYPVEVDDQLAALALELAVHVPFDETEMQADCESVCAQQED